MSGNIEAVASAAYEVGKWLFIGIGVIAIFALAIWSVSYLNDKYEGRRFLWPIFVLGSLAIWIWFFFTVVVALINIYGVTAAQ